MRKINSDIIAEAINDPNFSFLESFADASEPEIVQKEMTRLLFFHRKQRELLTIREREKVIIQNKYDKKRRESYLRNSDAPNEKTKTILVEIDTEKEKYELEIIEQKIKELNRIIASVKLEIDTLKMISYNIRTGMGVF